MRCEVIAELGVSHQGSLEKAKKMIQASKASHADFVKLQYFSLNDLDLHGLPDWKVKALLECELELGELRELKVYSENLELGWLATPMQNPQRIEEYMSLKPQLIKIREADSRNQDFISKALSYDVPLLISVDPRKGPYVKPDGTHCVWLMYVNPSYPPRLEEFDSGQLKYFDGFSNHFPDPIVPKMAVGAAWIRKKRFFWLEMHVRVDSWELDAPVSLTFEQFREVADYAHSIHRNGLGLE